MTGRDYLRDLKRIAKHHAKSQCIVLSDAQNQVAERLGFAHWYALATAVGRGHQLTADHVAAAEATLTENAEAFPDEGFAGPHPYRIDIVLDDVVMSGRGWQILIEEAPLSKPQCLVTDRPYKNNPIHDPGFVAAALQIAEGKAKQVRSSIAKDWPRGSTKPGASGQALHPIFGVRSDTWHCFHCSQKASGSAMAENLWHCPSCGASPIDIFATP
jgi:hypothetical protein